jgi:anti-sigma factor RsiW
MNNERFRQKLISRWLDGELSPAELVSFEQRLEQDPALAAALKANMKTHELIQGLPEIAVPAGFQERLRKARAEEVMSAKRVTFRGWRLVLTVTGATFIIGLLFQTTGIQQSFHPVAELSSPTQYTVVSSDSTYLHHDSATVRPEFQFTPVSGQ